jgi:hypothetical protein
VIGIVFEADEASDEDNERAWEEPEKVPAFVFTAIYVRERGKKMGRLGAGVRG